MIRWIKIPKWIDSEGTFRIYRIGIDDVAIQYIAIADPKVPIGNTTE